MEEEAENHSTSSMNPAVAASTPLQKLKKRFNKLKHGGSSLKLRSSFRASRVSNTSADSRSLSSLPEEIGRTHRIHKSLLHQESTQSSCGVSFSVDDVGDSSAYSSIDLPDDVSDSTAASEHERSVDLPAAVMHTEAANGEPVTTSVNEEPMMADQPGEETENVEMRIPAMKLELTLISGSDMIAKDRNGFSDPYVKVKHKNKTVYKTKVVHKSLNPTWDETCSLPIEELSHPLVLRVYDRDTFTEDDFMGETFLDLSLLQTDRPVDQSLDLMPGEDMDEENSEGDNESLGQIHIRYVLYTHDERVVQPAVDQSLVSNILKPEAGHAATSEWDYIVKVVLMDGSNLLAMDDNGLSDPYVRFKLQSEKYKTKVKNKTLNPKWMEAFSLHLYDSQSWELDIRVFDHNIAGRADFMGRTTLDLSKLQLDRTHEMTLQLVDQIGTLHLLVTITGAVSSTDHEVSSTARDEITRSYGLLNSFKNFKDVGWLQVKVIRAHDLSSKDWGGKSDPFCTVELINTMLQSHTSYSTLNPEWNRVFTMPVKDIHSVLEVTIYDEDKDMKREFIGKVAIPLIMIENGVQKWYGLKDRKLFSRVKGEVLLELGLVFNQVKAAIRTFNPREERMLQEEPKFKISLFKRNVNRVRAIGSSIMSAKGFWQSLIDWHYPSKTVIAFAAFMVAVWNFELYMLPLTLIMLFMWNLVVSEIKGGAGNDRVHFFGFGARGEADVEEEDADEEEDDKENKRSFREYIDVVKSICCTIQQALGQIADLGEAVKNSVNWTVPWLSTLAVVALHVIMLILYLIPLRYIILLWGINKFTKKLRKPNYIPNNEVLDYLSRVPSDVDKMMYNEILADPDRAKPNSPQLKSRKTVKSK